MMLNERWQIIYYIAPSREIPVKNFLDAARPQQKAKAFRLFLYIREYGLSAVITHVKKLTGTPLWEIRILGEDNMRILYVTQAEKRILLLHGFYKKTQKTPQKELAVALTRLKEFLARRS